MGRRVAYQLGIEQISVVYEVCNVRMINGMDVQSFLDHLLRVDHELVGDVD
jgi:hypothetical protein